MPAVLADQQHWRVLVPRHLHDFTLQLVEPQMTRLRQMALCERVGATQIDDERIAAIDQLRGIRGGQSAVAPRDNRPQQQPPGNEGNGNQYKVGWLGEKLHGWNSHKRR
ncbi:hypothetical protein DFQ28_000518 [Apophysomyces sp. BC1034]|nr:hypothetical protein DFQ28_000518 [Apophysomyces sp. BC1034]